MIRQPKSGDRNFPKEQDLTSKRSEIWIGDADNVLLYCIHLEALIRSVVLRMVAAFIVSAVTAKLNRHHQSATSQVSCRR